MTSFTRPSLAVSFFPASYKLKVGEEGLGTRHIRMWVVTQKFKTDQVKNLASKLPLSYLEGSSGSKRRETQLIDMYNI